MVDFSLYLVTDRSLCKKDLLETIIDAVKGGVKVVQLREKDCPTRKFVDLAKKVKKLLEPFSVPLIINDRVDVAVAVDADGVHVGQEDMHPLDVRKIVGDKMIVGLTVNSIQDVLEANKLPVDYLGAGPVFKTFTKKTTKPCLYPEGLKKLKELTDKKIVAIGGISHENVEEVVKTGVDGIAVVSAICASDNPYESAKRLYEAIKKSSIKNY